MSHTHTRAHRGFSPAAPQFFHASPVAPQFLLAMATAAATATVVLLNIRPWSESPGGGWLSYLGDDCGNTWRAGENFRQERAPQSAGIWRIRLGSGSPITGDCLLVVLTWVGNNYFGHAAAALPRRPSNGCLAPLRVLLTR